MKIKPQILIFLFIIILLGGFAFLLKLTCKPLKPINGTGSCNRIIALAPNITEILFSLGLGDKVVGVSEFCNYPPQAQQIPRVGALLNPNFEAIITAKPDLIIILDEMAVDKDKFTSLGIETLAVKHNNINEILNSISIIGSRCDKTVEAEKIVGEIENKLKRIQNAVQNRNRPRVLICVGHDSSQNPSDKLRNIYIVGNDGFYSQMIEYAGGKNAYNGKIPFPEISWESVISMNPQIIIDIAPVQTKPTDSGIMIMQWKNFAQIDAVKNNAVYVFTENYTAIPGPRFILTLEKIARIINPNNVIPVKTGIRNNDEANSN